MDSHATSQGDACGNARTGMLHVRVMHVEMHGQACRSSMSSAEGMPPRTLQGLFDMQKRMDMRAGRSAQAAA